MTARKKRDGDFDVLHYCDDARCVVALCGKLLQSRQVGPNLVYDATANPENANCLDCRARMSAWNVKGGAT